MFRKPLTSPTTVWCLLAAAVGALTIGSTRCPAAVQVLDAWWQSKTSIQAIDSNTPTVQWTPNPNGHPYRFSYMHWGDGMASPPAYTTDPRSGSKPHFPTHWLGDGTRVPSTGPAIETSNHPKGSLSESSWQLEFTTINNPAGWSLLPAIGGRVSANVALDVLESDVEAHTVTSWYDPFEIQVPRNSAVDVVIRNQFGRAKAAWYPENITNPLGHETGSGSIERYFYGSVSDALGNLGDRIELQNVRVGTHEDLFRVQLGRKVVFEDGMRADEKRDALLMHLHGSWWGIDNTTLPLDFRWHIPAAQYDRTVLIELGGILSANNSVLVPEPSSWLLIAVSLLGLAARRPTARRALGIQS